MRAKLRIVLVVRATKKLLDRCGGPSLSEQPATTALGDWYATALFWKPQVALFVNEPTRLPVFVPLAPAATLAPRFVSHLRAVFDVFRLDPRFIDSEISEMTEHRLAKTANRSVVGSMNDFSSLAEFHRDQHGSDDLLALSLELAHTPCGPLDKKRGFPDLELKAMVQQIPGIG